MGMQGRAAQGKKGLQGLSKIIAAAIIIELARHKQNNNNNNNNNNKSRSALHVH
jgi:hypothetical protein